MNKYIVICIVFLILGCHSGQDVQGEVTLKQIEQQLGEYNTSSDVVLLIERVYLGVFQREVGGVAIASYEEQFTNKELDLAEIIYSIFTSEEFYHRYVSDKTIEFAINSIYERLLKRTPTIDEFAIAREMLLDGSGWKTIIDDVITNNPLPVLTSENS